MCKVMALLYIIIFQNQMFLNIIFIRYDPKTDQWTMIAPMCTPRDAVGVCLLGDRLYAVGGYDGQQYLHDVECYDPVTNEWTKVYTFFTFLFSIFLIKTCV